MRILITNRTLDSRAGTQLYVLDIARALRRLGHEIVCFSPQLGQVAEELAAEGFPVTDTLNANLGTFDIIHGQHRVETALAALNFPRTPVISFCHGPLNWQESACTLPNVVQVVAVDMACRQRLIDEGVAESKIKVLLNFADTERFLPRPPLPDKPRKALIFSNYASEKTHLPAVREACARAGLELDVVGRAQGNATTEPEKLMLGYDIVFAKARAAIEAMAVGCAVIVCDFYGAGYLVTPENLDEMRPLNFGYKSINQPLDAEYLLSQIQLYDARAAATVSSRMRAEASLEATALQLVSIYEEALTAEIPPFDPSQAATALILALGEEAHLGSKASKALEKMANDYEARLTKVKEERQQFKDEARALGKELSALKARRERSWWKALLSKG